MKFMYLVFTRMPGELPHATWVFVVYLCYIFRALINSLVCWFCTSALDLVLFQISGIQCYIMYMYRCAYFPGSYWTYIGTSSGRSMWALTPWTQSTLGMRPTTQAPLTTLTCLKVGFSLRGHLHPTLFCQCLYHSVFVCSCLTSFFSLSSHPASQ